MTPLSLDELIAALTTLRDRAPQYGSRPVYVLVGQDGDGLVWRVELDCFEAERGPLVSLVCDRPDAPGESEKT